MAALQEVAINNYEKLTFYVDISITSDYSDFLAKFRKFLTGSTLDDYNMPILRSEWLTQGKLYCYVDLSYRGNLLTLGIDVVNLNLVAFKFESKSYFFSNTMDDDLFRGTIKVVMPFMNTYESLGNRADVKLGLPALQNALHVLIHYNEYKPSDHKTSIMSIMGMLLEATKLKRIEDDVAKVFYQDILLNTQEISYEDNWTKLSEDIQHAHLGILKCYTTGKIAAHQEDIIDYKKLAFFVDAATSKDYSDFLGNLRNFLTGSTLDGYDIPILHSESEAQGKLYCYVHIFDDRKCLTLVLDVVNLNLMAFKVGTTGYFFSNTKDNDLFEDITEEVVMPFMNTYSSLGHQAMVRLGKHALQNAVSVLISYEHQKVLTVKTSIINVMGMVLEATKLKCIENHVTKDFEKDILLNFEEIRYENIWAKLSEDIQRADPGILKYYPDDSMNYKKLKFNIDAPTASNYSDFLEKLRNILKGGTIGNYNLRFLRDEFEAQRRGFYCYVDISYASKILTLAFDVVNLDFLAFQFEFESESTSYFFSNTSYHTNLFHTKNRVIMPFSNTYPSLGNRKEVNLGMNAMQNAFNVLTDYDKQDISAIKTSIINVMAMVLEATKFKVIEDTINNYYDKDIPTNIDVIISYEDAWDELSKNIQNANIENGDFPYHVVVKNMDGSDRFLRTVAEVQLKIGILKYYPRTEAN